MKETIQPIIIENIAKNTKVLCAKKLLNKFLRKQLNVENGEIFHYKISSLKEISINNEKFYEFQIKVDKLKKENIKLNEHNHKKLYFQLRKLDSSQNIYICKNNSKEFTASILLPTKENDLIFDEYDMSPNAKELYKKTFVNLTENEKGILNYAYRKTENIECSGDIIFNFKTTKIEPLKKIIDEDNFEDDKEYKEYVKNLLDVCRKVFRAPENITVLPKKGGLNNIKQNIGNDRFDVFITAVKLYYEGHESIILDNYNCTPQCRPNLQNFLNSFGKGSDGFYNFVKTIYHIDNTQFVDKICVLGKTTINSTISIHKYIMLAYRYWILMSEFYANNENTFTTYKKFSNKNIYIEFLNYIIDEQYLKYTKKIDDWFFEK